MQRRSDTRQLPPREADPGGAVARAADGDPPLVFPISAPVHRAQSVAPTRVSASPRREQRPCDPRYTPGGRLGTDVRLFMRNPEPAFTAT